MIITISGTPGSGKNTIADLLAEKLNLKRYSVGNFRREMAKKLGLSIHELNALGEKQAFTDKDADEWQINIGKREDNFIIDGRLSYHFIPNSIKIFLDVSPPIGARRIMEHCREEDKSDCDAQALKQWHERYNSDLRRYSQYYNLNPYDKSQYDFILDTSNLDIQEVLNRVIAFLEKNGKNKPK